MAKLSNINGKFAVEDTGAIRFSDQTGTTGQILKSNGNSAPTWVDPNTVGTGPWLPLAGGIVSGATTFQSSLTVGGTLTVNGSGGSVFNSTATTNHIIAAYRASNGNNVATFRTTDSGYIFRIHAQNAGTIYVQNDDGSNYIKIPDSGSNEVSGNTTFAGNVTLSQPTNGAEAKLTLTSKSAAGNSRTGIIEYDADVEKIFFINEGSTVAAITSDAKVGIGTDSPASKLVVRTSTDHNFEVEETGGELRLSALNNARSANIGLQFAASEFNFLTGNVGIGVTVPGARLELDNPSAFTNMIEYGNVAWNQNTGHGLVAVNRGSDGYVQLQITSGVDNADVFTIRNSGTGANIQHNFLSNGGAYHAGNVGIGVTPTQKLDVDGQMTHDGLVMKSGTGLYVDTVTEFNITLDFVAGNWISSGLTSVSNNGLTLGNAGTYIMQVYSDDHSPGEPFWYAMYWSGIMSWYNSTTNQANTQNPIVLQKAGHGDNGRSLEAQILWQTASGTPANNGLLQFKCSATAPGTTLRLRFRRLI